MAIEIITTDGITKQFVHALTCVRTEDKFAVYQRLVDGYIECHAVREKDKIVDVLCNEDGLSAGLQPNRAATDRFRGKLRMAPHMVGTVIVLSGKDRLR